MGKIALVVDDDPIIRNLMATLLRRRGIMAAQAVNGEEAIALLKAEGQNRAVMPYDLVVLDMMMPKASGWDVIDFVQKELPDSLRHVIVVSAAGEDALSSISERGCGCILQKPFTPEAFYESVFRCIRGPRSSGASGSGGAEGVPKGDVLLESLPF